MNNKLLCLLLSLFSFSALAVDVPSAAETKKVLDFYYNGQGQGVVLFETLLCKEIAKEGDNKNNCSEVITNGTATKGEAVNLWMAYLVPNGEENQNIIVQFEHKGVTRMVKNIQINGSIRYRTWRKISFNKTGSWTAKIFHEKGDDTILLNSVNITVVDGPAAPAP